MIFVGNYINNLLYCFLYMYNNNTEKDPLNTINEFSGMLKSVNNISAKQIILGSDCNLCFDSLLESQGRNHILKKIYCQNDWT